MPYTLGLDTLGTEIIYDSGDYALLLDKALQAAGWDELQTATRARAASAGEIVGAGVAMFVEKSGLGPFDTVRVEVKPDGGVEVITGVASVGQGIETVIAQICADALGVDYRDNPRRSTARPTASTTRHGRVRLARHGDVRRGHTACSHASYARRRSGRRRADADRRRRARYRRTA